MCLGQTGYRLANDKLKILKCSCGISPSTPQSQMACLQDLAHLLLWLNQEGTALCVWLRELTELIAHSIAKHAARVRVSVQRNMKQ